MLTTSQINTLLKPMPPRMEIVASEYPKLVMDYFHKHYEGTSHEVAKYTGICNSTANKIMRELKDKGKLSVKIEKKQARNSAGGITTTTYNVYRLIDR